MDILKDKNNGNYIKDINPYERYEKIDNDIISFYMQYKKNLFPKKRFFFHPILQL